MSQNHPPGTPPPGPSPFPLPPGPTHPTPTGPARPKSSDSGHLPPGDISMLRTAGRAYPLPRLGEMIRDAERQLAQAITTLGRQYDPASAPAEGEGPWEFMPGFTDRLLCSAVANIRLAVDDLRHLADSDLPRVGSAVQFPARQESVEAGEGLLGIATTGGPLTTGPDTGDEGRTPGPAAAMAPASAAGESPERREGALGAGVSFAVGGRVR